MQRLVANGGHCRHRAGRPGNAALPRGGSGAQSGAACGAVGGLGFAGRPAIGCSFAFALEIVAGGFPGQQPEAGRAWLPLGDNVLAVCEFDQFEALDAVVPAEGGECSHHTVLPAGRGSVHTVQ